VPVIRWLTSHAVLTKHWLMIWIADVHNVTFQLYLLIMGVGYWLLVSAFHCVPWTWLLYVDISCVTCTCHVWVCVLYFACTSR